MSCLFLYRMFGFHIQLICHLISVISVHIGIQRFIVSGNGTTDRCSMCCKDCRHFRQLFLYIQSPHSQHPLIKMSDNRFIFQFIIMIKAFYDLSYRIGKNTRFVIISVCMNRIDMKMFPHHVVQRIFFREEWLEINQNDRRHSWHIPTPYFHP